VRELVGAACSTLLLLVLIGCDSSTQSTNVSSDASKAPTSATLIRDSMVFTTTAGYCEWLNEQKALALGRRYIPHGDMGQTEVGQLVNSGDSVEIGKPTQTLCRDLRGNVSSKMPVWIQDEKNGASGYIDWSVISSAGHGRPSAADSLASGVPGAPPGSPMVTPPPLVIAEGYMDALNDSINNNKPAFDEVVSDKCVLQAARYYLAVGQREFQNAHYSRARTDAWSAYHYAQCGSDGADKEDGDALLLFSKSEARLGIRSGAKQDAANAANSYQNCTNADKVYGQDDQKYCTVQMSEAQRVANGGD